MSESAAGWTDSWGETEEAAETASEAVDDLSGSLDEATEATNALTSEQLQQIKASNEHAAAISALKDELLGLPTAKVKEDAELLRQTWAAMNEDERAKATDNYRESLQKLTEQGIKLTAEEMIALDGDIKKVKAEFIQATPKVALFTEKIAAIPKVAEPVPSLLQKIGSGLKSAFVDNFKEAFSADRIADLVNGVLTGARSLKDGLKSLGNQAADWLGALAGRGVGRRARGRSPPVEARPVHRGRSQEDRQEGVGLARIWGERRREGRA